MGRNHYFGDLFLTLSVTSTAYMLNRLKTECLAIFHTGFCPGRSPCLAGSSPTSLRLNLLVLVGSSSTSCTAPSLLKGIGTGSQLQLSAV